MTSNVEGRIRILAGAPGADRRAIPRPGSMPRWFEPLHVREPAQVRSEMAAQVTTGADVLVAPAWLTHRRGLEPVGETRRARAWTEAAVRIARDAAEVGMERREGVTTSVQVLGPLPDITARPEGTTGRRLPADAAATRDELSQAGILADCGVDGVLIEPRPSLDRARESLAAVVEVGSSAWMILSISDRGLTPDTNSLREWLETLVGLGVDTILLRPGGGIVERSLLELTVSTVPGQALGILLPDPASTPARETIGVWFEAGASVLGIADGATPDALEALTAARKEHESGIIEARTADDAETTAWTAEAIRRAPGGRGLWVGDAPDPLPAGFDWTVVPGADTGDLPLRAWRIVVGTGPIDPMLAATLLDDGGIVAAHTADPDTLVSRAGAAGLRLVDVRSQEDGPTRYIARRED